MIRLLFVANGHGENAIAARIAGAVLNIAAQPLRLELLPLIGDGAGVGAGAGAPFTSGLEDGAHANAASAASRTAGGAVALQVVGPRKVLPSGGLVAMGNIAAFARDVLAGFPVLLAAQVAFLRRARGRYAAVVAVGDAYALGLAFLAAARPIFVGTAKSVFVAPYGPFERSLLRRAGKVYVRDLPTARELARHGTPAEAPGNVIADLATPDFPAMDGAWLGLLPGSRRHAYADGVRLAGVARTLAARRPTIGALLSVAPTLDAERFAQFLRADGWTVGPLKNVAAPTRADNEGGPARWSAESVAFQAHCGAARLVGWRGPLGALLAASTVVLGQAGTGNEQAAARGLPVVALEGTAGRREDWYRMRQRRLLGDALLLVPAAPSDAAAALDRLLGDPGRLAAMAVAGQVRMGPPGGAPAIGRGILACAGIEQR